MNTTYDDQTAALARRSGRRIAAILELGDRLFSQATSLARRIALLCADPIGERFAQERWRDEQMLRRHWR
jgi:hypothetical protein